MREQIREFIEALSKEEQMEIVQTLVVRWAKGVQEERSFLDADGVVVGYYVPFAKWLESHPPTALPGYATEEEATAAAKNGRSLSEIVAEFNAMYPAEAEPIDPR
jgi:hypothetical protein